MSERVLLVKLDKPAGGQLRLSFSEPIGLCYISATLKSHGIDCRLLHLIRDSAKEDLLSKIEEYRPTIIGFSVRSFNYNISGDCIQLIRRQYPGLRIVIGGECITPENAIKLAKNADADLAVIGDGELSLLDYSQGTIPAQIAGVVYRSEGDTFRQSEKPACRVDPALLPMMDRTDLPMSDYLSEAYPGKRYSTMHTQRGCRYKCTFCHTASRYRGPMARTVDQVLEEVDCLTNHYETEALAIWDEDFFSNAKRVRLIAQGLIDRGSPVQWQTFMKLTDLKNKQIQQILPLLRKSNYLRAVIGLESFLPATLRYYHKAGGPDVEESLELLSKNGILICPAYIIGEPHESYDNIKYGLTHLLKLRERGITMDLPYIAFITPFPGTPLYDEYKNKGYIIDHNWVNHDGDHVVVKSRCSAEQLIELRDWFYSEFNGATS